MKRRFGMVTILLTFLASISVAAVFCEDEGVKVTKVNSGYEICEITYTLPDGCSFSCVQVCGMEDKVLQDKVNNSLTQYFSILIEPWFLKERIQPRAPIVHMQTDRYLSVEYIFCYITAIDKRWYLCVTVDMQTGDVVFLDDLIDINEGFAELLRTGGVIRRGEVEGIYTAEEATEQANQEYARYDTERILRGLRQFTHKYLYGDAYEGLDRSEEWRVSMHTYLYCKFYYLEEGSFCYAESTEGLCRTRIMTEDIEEYLKVEPW